MTIMTPCDIPLRIGLVARKATFGTCMALARLFHHMESHMHRSEATLRNLFG
jgi:hypothetical protein